MLWLKKTGINFVGCNKLGPCLEKPCFPSVECHNVGNESFKCESCPNGFEGDGKSCSDIDEVTPSYWKYNMLGIDCPADLYWLAAWLSD